MTIRVLELNYLQQLSRKILASTNGIEVEQLFRELLDFYSILNFSFRYTGVIWRGRKCLHSTGFAKIDEMLSPPCRLAKAGRLNESGTPILYASINQFAVLQELGASKGDFIQFLGMKIAPHKSIICAVIGERMNVHRSGRAWISEEIGKKVNRILNEMPFEAAKSYVFTDAFLATLLCDKDAYKNEYIHSRILSKLILEKLNHLDGIIYPSVALGNSTNFAIKPESASLALDIEATFVVEINKVFDYGIYETKIVNRAEGHDSDGQIKWA